jgi:hypothetical protein
MNTSSPTTKEKQMKTTLDTRTYERSHWHKPRGRGYWAFIRPEDDPSDMGAVVWMSGTLTECKQALPGGEWVVLP